MESIDFPQGDYKRQKQGHDQEHPETQKRDEAQKGRMHGNGIAVLLERNQKPEGDRHGWKIEHPIQCKEELRDVRKNKVLPVETCVCLTKSRCRYLISSCENGLQDNRDDAVCCDGLLHHLICERLG